MSVRHLVSCREGGQYDEDGEEVSSLVKLVSREPPPAQGHPSGRLHDLHDLICYW